ncbi:carnitine O-acetyltransferase-like isoform X2 [Atheta coriaria]
MYSNILKLIAQNKVSPRVVLTTNNVLAKRTPVFPVYSKEYSSNQLKDLAKQPVPKLADTLERFLDTCKPLLTPQELKETAKHAQNFAIQDGQACKMQCLLLERAKKCENWLADWWLQAAYLDYRNSVIGWSSPGTPFAYQKFKCDEEWIKYSANVVLGALAFKKKIDNGEIKQEMMGKMPLDMQQYHKVLGTCRIPGEKSDCLQYNTDSKHIVVVCNNHFYKIDVYDDCKCPISQKQLIEQLTSIVKYSTEPAPGVGILSGTHRDTWGKNYKALFAAAQCNEACIRYIQRSLFLLCLDTPIKELGDENKLTISGMQTIHGGGSKYNSCNRWFDKCIQFVVSSDGHNGITYEHSPAEGGPVTTMGDFIQDYIANSEGDKTKDAALKDPVPRTLVFKLNEQLCKSIDKAKEEVDKFIADFDVKVYKFDEYGKEFIKAQKLSPDSYIQVAFQLAYYRLHNEPAPTYESAAMRHFIHGRTETIRSCTCAAVAFAEAMCDEASDDATRVQKLKLAVNAHKDYVKAVLAGNGVDRHLLGLKLQALEKNIKPHEFFKSVGYVRSSSFKLSTSQVPTKHEGFMGYGPSDPDGYGICYNPRPDDIIMSVASFKCSKIASTEDMVKSLKDAFVDMQDLLCKTNKSKL